MDTLRSEDLKITRLGEPAISSPFGGQKTRYIEKNRILVYADTDTLEPMLEKGQLPAFEEAGPTKKIFHEPTSLTAGIVTCGGLCPGLNDVIRSLVLTSHHGYGVRRVLGFRYGYRGITAGRSAQPAELTPASVQQIHQSGGTVIGTSRGPQDVAEMVDTLIEHGVGILYAVGGDGTLSGASEIALEALRRNIPLGVIGVPKTIDNDLVWTERTFGFATAVDEAEDAIRAAHCEAESAWNGVGLVKLMGRYSGFVAAHATLASGDVNFCMIPEVPFALEGDGGFFDLLAKRLEDRRHAVVVVAEGAGQELMQPDDAERDASGNIRLEDIGVFMRERIRAYFGGRDIPVDVKYIDPSYTIRSAPANSIDSAFCLTLGQHAVHAGMAGCTDMMVGFWNHRFTQVPLSLVAGRRKRVEPDAELWQRVLDTTGQPAALGKVEAE